LDAVKNLPFFPPYSQIGRPDSDSAPLSTENSLFFRPVAAPVIFGPCLLPLSHQADDTEPPSFSCSSVNFFFVILRSLCMFLRSPQTPDLDGFSLLKLSPLPTCFIRLSLDKLRFLPRFYQHSLHGWACFSLYNQCRPGPPQRVEYERFFFPLPTVVLFSPANASASSFPPDVGPAPEILLLIPDTGHEPFST